jgi:outer membrane protein OmpA-like peptidoglycan-associated protein
LAKVFQSNAGEAMRIFPSIILAVLIAAPGMALAAVRTGNEVSVNPLPAGGGNVLLYPGGQYMRVVQPLRQPGQTARDNGPIQLRMPGTRSAAVPAARRASAPRAAVAAAPRPARTAVAAPAPKPESAKPEPSKPEPVKRTAAAPPPSPPPSPPPPAKRTAAASPPPASTAGYNAGYGAFGAPAMDQSIVAPSQPAPRQAPRQQPAQLAKATPPPASASGVSVPPEPGLTKRSVILFAAGASDPAQSALGSIKFLAGDLNSSMTGAGSRIQLLAYGGDKGDKSSDARRLSLKRALAIRQVLIDDGVPAERIDVRAMGGADDGGPSDRVDVFVKA